MGDSIAYKKYIQVLVGLIKGHKSKGKHHMHGEGQQARRGEEEKCAFLGGEEGGHGCKHVGGLGIKRVLEHGQSQEEEAP